MKTKPYTPPPAEIPVNAEATFPVDLPCMMWIGAKQPVGPIPLGVCMFKALELAREPGASFAIRGEASLKTILTLRAKVVDGEPAVVDVFMLQVALADQFVKKIFAGASTAAPAAPHSPPEPPADTAHRVAEKQLGNQRPSKKG